MSNRMQSHAFALGDCAQRITAVKHVIREEQALVTIVSSIH